ncbi:sugar transferase [Pararhizobium sp. LjRoot235]|uniref:sugar transferase n=1 Tax=Pararhizobium sp. LjRoot235 TaxID=3342291 RepID=UPI003ECFF04C
MSKGELQYSLRLVPQRIPDRQTIKSRFLYFAAKRTFDIAMTVLAAPFALTIVGIFALLIRMDGGKAFYCQPRVGKGGRIFNLWKLRTMAPDAEQRLRAHLAADPSARVQNGRRCRSSEMIHASLGWVNICANTLSMSSRNY